MKDIISFGELTGYDEDVIDIQDDNDLVIDLSEEGGYEDIEPNI